MLIIYLRRYYEPIVTPKSPKNLTSLIRLMYSQKCKEHSKILNQEHSECHNIIVNPMELWQEYSNGDRKVKR